MDRTYNFKSVSDFQSSSTCVLPAFTWDHPGTHFYLNYLYMLRYIHTNYIYKVIYTHTHTRVHIYIKISKTPNQPPQKSTPTQQLHNRNVDDRLLQFSIAPVSSFRYQYLWSFYIHLFPKSPERSLKCLLIKRK